MRGVRKSIHVFGELFGEGTAKDLERLADTVIPGEVKPRLSRSLARLRMMLHAILTQAPSTSEAEEIAEIIDRTIEELRKHVKDD